MDREEDHYKIAVSQIEVKGNVCIVLSPRESEALYGVLWCGWRTLLLLAWTVILVFKYLWLFWYYLSSAFLVF